MQRFWPLLAWIAYLLLPFDLLPDFLLGLGWTDDLVLLALIYYFFFRKGAFDESKTSSRTSNTGRESTGFESRSKTENSQGSRTGNKGKNPYEILGVSPGADPETVKKAYRHMAAKYHPDKVSHLGEEFQQLAKEKFQEIQWAYEVLSRGWQESKP